MTGGKLYCWGYNANGQLGNASLNNKKRPTPVSSTLQFRWVSAGPVTPVPSLPTPRPTVGAPMAMGQLGDGTTTDRWSPTLVFGGLSWKQIEVGGDSAEIPASPAVSPRAGGSTAGVTTTLASWATAPPATTQVFDTHANHQHRGHVPAARHRRMPQLRSQYGERGVLLGIRPIRANG